MKAAGSAGGVRFGGDGGRGIFYRPRMWRMSVDDALMMATSDSGGVRCPSRPDLLLTHLMLFDEQMSR